ncbi:hypothetical protein AC1031_015690 [Aphanomyces cochlioides]|nr:hypothetical protein AC1031_015690 [Aphanomyces cochlioides]
MSGKLRTPAEMDSLFARAIEKLDSSVEGKDKAAKIDKATPAKSPEEAVRKTKKRSPIVSYSSLESQRVLVTLARLVHKEQMEKSDYTIMPASFDVPDKDPWPENLRGETININGFRTAKKKDQIHPKVEKRLNAIKFVWDIQQHKWDLNLWALKIYKALHGDLFMDPSYEISDKDPAFPRDMWKFPLGQWLAKTKANIRELSEDKKRLLAEAGVHWIE